MNLGAESVSAAILVVIPLARILGEDDSFLLGFTRAFLSAFEFAGGDRLTLLHTKLFVQESSM